MKGGAIIPFHHCILLFHVTTFIDENLHIPSKTFLYTEEDPHQESKHVYM